MAINTSKAIPGLAEAKKELQSLLTDPTRRNELINFNPETSQNLALKILPKFNPDYNFNEERKKVINDATASAIQQQAQTRSGYAGVDIQMQNERKKLLNESDLKAQEEALKKRTTFAGSSMQGVMERKKLLGI